MPEYLETTVDKFTFRVATDRLYSEDGFWVRPEENNRVRLGITDFLSQRSGDVAFVFVQQPDTPITVGKDFAEMETIKVNLALPSPVAGTLVEANPALEATPEIVNKDPYGAGWIAVLKVSDWEKDRAMLLEPQAYFRIMRSQAEQEAKKP